MGRLKAKNTLAAMACVIVLAVLSSCSKNSLFDHPTAGYVATNTPANREASPECRRVLLLYSAGFSNLSGHLKKDITELLEGVVPGERRTDDVLLVYGHHCKSTYYDYTEPVLFQAYTKDGIVVRDTLKTWPKGTISADAAHFHEVLTYVKDNFPAKSYDMVFSSHASGWIPLDTSDDSSDFFTASAEEEPCVEKRPQRVIGATLMGKDQYWMDISDFANAIPMKLDNLMLDCCLCGCVEVAYELKDKCHSIVFSPTEILVNGFAYKTLFEHLYASNVTDPVTIAKDYFAQYSSGSYATVSVVDCSKIEALAETTASIVANHADAIRGLEKAGIQKYFTLNQHRFLYDFRDILSHGGASKAELAQLDSRLNDCLMYKNATAIFRGEGGTIYITNYSGLSCFLPSTGNDKVNTKYRTLKWNERVGLVN